MVETRLSHNFTLGESMSFEIVAQPLFETACIKDNALKQLAELVIAVYEFIPRPHH
ncbi:MAG: hypothetical protein IJ125_09330 [Atopobiaceae bacterium]|nr:hypothetical protein [Atopobiaceae bacterium]